MDEDGTERDEATPDNFRGGVGKRTGRLLPTFLHRWLHRWVPSWLLRWWYT